MKNAEYFDEQAKRYGDNLALAEAPQTLDGLLSLRAKKGLAPTLRSLLTRSDGPPRGQPVQQIRLGTRGSPLALRQANEVRRRLLAAHPILLDPDSVVIVPVATTGDVIRDRPLYDIGGKGLFTKELDDAMAENLIDIAVHSLKDVPTWLPSGQVIAAMLPREDPRDFLLTADQGETAARRITDLPVGCVVGSCSPRRQAQLLHLRPDLKVVMLRGNVGTRMRKLAEGDFGATILATAGLNRLEMSPVGVHIDPTEMLPAAAQGVIGVTCREEDEAIRALMDGISHPATYRAAAAERAMLDVLDGSCRTPIGGLAVEHEGMITLTGLIALPDGSALHRCAETAPRGDWERLGRSVGEELRRRAGPAFIRAVGCD